MGTAIAAGGAQAEVVATGAATELGKIAGLLDRVEDEQTPLQRRLDLGDVAGIGRADEEVVGDVDPRHQVEEALRVAIGQLLRRDPLLLGGERDRLAEVLAEVCG